jgi:hypothetical protein
MAADNTIPEAVPGANTSGSDSTVSEAIPRTITRKSDDAISELIACESIANSHEIFPFEKLPPELRDLIYDLLFQERRGAIHLWHYKIRTALPTIRLVNSRLKFEFDERSPVNSFIEASECPWMGDGCLCLDTYESFPSSIAARTTDMHINYFIACKREASYACRCPRMERFTQVDLRVQLGPWMDDLIKDLPLRNMTMNISCGNVECAMALQSSGEIWPSTPNLSRISLLKPIYHFDPDSEAYSDESLPPPLQPTRVFELRETMATWTPTRGWLADAEVVDRGRKDEAEFMKAQRRTPDVTV